MADSGAPISFRWEWNLNTVAVLCGFVAGFVAWGYTLAEMRNGRQQDARNIERLSADGIAMAARVETLDRQLSKFDQTDYRMAQMEKAQEALDVRVSRIVESYSTQFSEFRTQLSAISTQLALTNQTLQRLDVRGEPGARQQLQTPP